MGSVKAEVGGAARKRRRVPVVVACAVALLAAAVVFALFAGGVVVPPGMAAKYNLVSYVSEADVDAYIATYREQTGNAGSDESWAAQLEEEGLDESGLRDKTIRQLIIDREVERKAAELSLTADESDIDARVQTLRGNFAFDDDELWAKALDMYGQTEGGLRDMYRHSLLQDALCAAEVPVPEPSDDQVARYLELTYPDGETAKHVYYLTVPNDDADGGYGSMLVAQQVRNRLAEGVVTVDAFSAAVQAVCADADLVSRGGADGWDLDMDDRSASYQAAVEETAVGEVSRVFRDDAAGVYGFVWIDSSFEISGSSDIAAMPDSLRDYFSDRVSVILWEDDCDAYIANLYDASNPVIFPA